MTLTQVRLMNRLAAAVVACACGFATPFRAWSSSFLPATTDRQVQMSAAIFRGAVVDSQAYESASDGQIYTRTLVRVDEVFKGKLPTLVQLVHRGGTVGNRGQLDGFSPQFTLGEERLFFVSRRADGTLFATRGHGSAPKVAAADAASASSELTAGKTLLQELRDRTTSGPLAGSDVTDQSASTQTLTSLATLKAPVPSSAASSSATNLMVSSDTLPARFLLPDRGDPIPYLIDADYLPAGMTQTQAVTAVQNALAAWTNATSLRYRFAGIQSFGAAAPNITTQDGSLRIQLHDHYGYLAGGGSSGDLLGTGGHDWSVLTLTNGWTTGGNVAGNDFDKVTRGYVVLQHTNTVMQSLSTFTEALCHEIGHTIGLAHSSVNPSESNPILKQAMMYYLVHADGRGATLNSFDTNVSRQIHPAYNTPPYCYDRCLDIVTTSVRPLNVAGVNTAQVRGYDLQNNNLTLATNGATSNNGTFSLANSNITYVPKAFYGDSGRLDPASGSYYDAIYARYSDGTNASPYVMMRVLSYNADSYSEGIPDAWRLSYFGNANPATGLKHRAADDADGDGYSNLQEFLLGSNPTNKTSNLRFTSITPSKIQWQAKGYEVYELRYSTNFTNWARGVSPITPTNSTGAATFFTNGGPRQFFRVYRVP
jgi:hypothetical protein